VISTSAVVTHR